jgi:uncharacterized protein (TIGR02117 family)
VSACAQIGVARLCLLTFFMALFCASGSRSATASVVYVARRGWHIDVGMATADLLPPLKSVAADLPAAHYLFFGFGDKHYLMAKNHAAPVLLSALWPGAGIILTTGIEGKPDAGFGADHVVELRVSEDQARALQAFIWASMMQQGDSVSVYSSGPYEDSAYYLATPKYSALHTCNTWAAEALRAAGLRVRPGGVIFAGQLWSQVRRLKRSESADLSGSALPGRASLLLRGSLIGRAAAFRSDKPPWSSSSAAPPPSFSAAAADCCC